MASEAIAHSAFSLMGYWLRAHLGWRNNYCLIDSTLLQTESYSILYLAFRTIAFLT